MTCIYCGYLYCKCEEVKDPKDQRIAKLEAKLALERKKVQVLAEATEGIALHVTKQKDRLTELEAENRDLALQLGQQVQSTLSLKAELALERKWGHKNCTKSNCVSSGVKCPKAKETE